MGNMPESNNGKPEKLEGGIILPLSVQELHAKVNEHQKMKESLMNTPATVKKPLDEYDAFRQASREKVKAMEFRNDSIEIISNTPNVAAGIAANMEAFSKADPDKRLTWKQKTEMPVLLNIVNNTRAIEKAALTPDSKIVIPEGRKLRGQLEMSLDARTEGDLRLKREKGIFSTEDRFILRPEAGKQKGGAEGGPVDFVAYDKKDFATIGQEYQNSVGNPTVVPVKKDVMSPDSIDINLDISKEKIDTQKAEAEALIARLEARNAAKKQVGANGRPLGGEVTVNNFSAEEQAKKKAEWLRDHPEGDGNDDVLSQKNAKLEGADPDARIVIKPEALDNPDARIIVKPKNPAEGMPVQERQALEKVFVTAAEKAPERMEKISQVLEQRRENSKTNLEKMGLKLAGGLEAWKNVKPRYKLALGLTLAGASVATGGLTSILSTGASALSYGSGFYDKILKAEQAKNPDVKKGWIAARSLGYGIAAAIGSSMLIGQIFQNIDVPEALDAAKEKLSSLKDSIKSWFSSAADVAPTHVPSGGVTWTPDQLATLDQASAAPGMMMPEYVVHSGDNLTNIIKEQVLTKIPGVESFTELQKRNLIENYLHEAAKNKNIPYFDSVNQFSDPNLIQPGAKLDLEAIRRGMTDLKFNGETLLDHAKAITGSGSGASGGVFSSSPVASPSDVMVSSPASAVADAAPAVVKAPEGVTVAPDKSNLGSGLKMNSTGEGMVRSQGIDVSFEEGDLPPQADPGVWRDGRGNPVLDGSGNPVRTADINDSRG